MARRGLVSSMFKPRSRAPAAQHRERRLATLMPSARGSDRRDARARHTQDERGHGLTAAAFDHPRGQILAPLHGA